MGSEETLPLYALGRRIMVCGPSNSGKSTLALAIGTKLGLPVIHLDLLYHVPLSDWVPRPAADFVASHDAAVETEAWVMDGNYSKVMESRLARATGIVLLGERRWSALWRYLKRTLFQKERAGNLPGAKDSIKWEMIHLIMVIQPQRRAQSVARLRDAKRPMVQIESMRELRALYSTWGLDGPGRRPLRAELG
jgi:adenylate kinase family enzyme